MSKGRVRRPRFISYEDLDRIFGGKKEAAKCNCTLVQSLVGDGCPVCQSYTWLKMEEKWKLEDDEQGWNNE